MSRDMMIAIKNSCKLTQLFIIFFLPIILYGCVIKNALSVPLSTLALLFIYRIKWNRRILINLSLGVLYYITSKILTLYSGISIQDRGILTILMLFTFILLCSREYLDYKIRNTIELHVISGHGDIYGKDCYAKCVGECNHPTGGSTIKGDMIYLVNDGELQEDEKL